MAVNTMPKSTKYSLVWTGGSLELATDPRGWQEDAVAFSRDENHGINVQNVVSLSFSGAARDKIKEFAWQMYLRGAQETMLFVERRYPDWDKEKDDL